jgi:uncharacterized membrane protein
MEKSWHDEVLAKVERIERHVDDMVLYNKDIGKIYEEVRIAKSEIINMSVKLEKINRRITWLFVFLWVIFCDVVFRK